MHFGMEHGTDRCSAFNSTGGSWVKIAESVDRLEEDCRARWRDVLRTDREKGEFS